MLCRLQKAAVIAVDNSAWAETKSKAQRRKETNPSIKLPLNYQYSNQINSIIFEEKNSKFIARVFGICRYLSRDVLIEL